MALAMFYIFNKRTNSTKRPADEISYNIQVNLKKPTSLHNPTLQISTSNITMENMIKFNYCMFENQYYWITDKRIMSNTIIEFDMKEDVLATYTEEILATTAYVSYSEQGSNYLIDSRLGIRTDYLTDSVSKSLDTIFSTTIKYILTVAGNDGVAAAYLMTYNELITFGEKMSDATFLDAIIQWFNNPWEAIISLQMTPFNISGTSTEIYIADYATGVTGVLFSTSTAISDITYTLPIPKLYSDFRGHGEFTSAILELPYVGSVEIDMNRLATVSNLLIMVYAQYATGNIIYRLLQDTPDGTATEPFAYYAGNANSSIPISRTSSMNNFAAGISGMVTTIASQVTHNPVMTAQGILMMGNAARVHTTINGTLSSSLFSKISNTAKLTVFSQKTQMSPSDITTTLGNPTNKCYTLSDLTGYVKTVNASVSASATIEEIDEINTLLDGGVYIE